MAGDVVSVDRDIRMPTAADAIDGVMPARIVTPASADALAGALAVAAAAGHRTIVRGGGTKIGWGRRPDRVDLVLDTTALDRVLVHRHGDLIATIEAGARLDRVDAVLRQQGQWLPIDRAFAAATVGGVLATNDSGPLRHRYGTPRDQLIGITLALADGRLVRAGGEVVKNVAGYDLGKLVTGSHGTLAAIVSATFKLAPVPASSRTIVVSGLEARAAAELRQAVSDGVWEPQVFEVRQDPDGWTLLVCFASTPAAVEAQVLAVARLCGARAVRVVEDDDERVLWREHASRVWKGEALVVRCAWLPAELGAVADVLARVASGTGAALSLTGRAGVGAGHIAIEGAVDAQVRAVDALRASAPIIQHIVVLRASNDVKARVNVWGDFGATAPVLAALKHTLDPTDVLGAGRGPA